MIKTINAVDFEHFVNKSVLPKSLIDYTLLETNLNHSTLYFEYGNYTSGIKSIELESSISFYNLSTNLTIINTLSIGTYVDSINILASNDSNLTNTTTSITFSFTILNDINISNETKFIQIDLNTFKYITCDKDLPFNTSFTTSISLNFDTISNCNGFLTCPYNLETSMKEITINISIPKTTFPSTYENIAKFGIGSDFDNITFIFEVQSCVQNVSDICNIIQGNDEIVLCDKVMIQNLISRNFTKIEKEYIYDNFTNTTIRELVDIGDPRTLELLKNLHSATSECLLSISRIRDIENNLVQKQQEIESCMNEKEALSLQLPELVNRGTSDLSFRLQNATQQYINLARESWNKYVLIWIGVISLFIGGLGYGITKWQKNRII